MLALMLLAGGVVGAQFATRASSLLRGEQARAILALMVLGVSLKLAVDLVDEPEEVYSLQVTEVGACSACRRSPGRWPCRSWATCWRRKRMGLGQAKEVAVR